MRLIFAYDLFIFGKATTKQMSCVKNILNLFYNMLGQQVNNEMTRALLSSNTLIHVRRELIIMSGYKETMELGMYLVVSIMGKSLINHFRTIISTCLYLAFHYFLIILFSFIVFYALVMCLSSGPNEYSR